MALLVAEQYPESTPTAEAAVVAYRQERTPDEGTSVPGILSFEEHVVAISAWLAPLFELGNRFVQVGRAISRSLWPEWPVNVSPSVICNRLGSAPDRIREWRRSAARAGSRRALEFVTSWYPGVSLGQLAAKRENDEPVDPIF